MRTGSTKMKGCKRHFQVSAIILSVVAFSGTGHAQSLAAQLDAEQRIARDNKLLDVWWMLPEISKSCEKARLQDFAGVVVYEYILTKGLEKRRGEFAKAFSEEFKEEIGKIRNLKGKALDRAFCRMARSKTEEFAKLHGIRLVNWK